MNHNFPKITIVTPSYNQGEFIEATILSVLSQNYPNLEYIIIDGGSTDNTLSIIQKYSNQLKYWISEPDKGQYDAINKGFAISTGEIMSYINSDDIYHEKCFFSIAQIFQDYAHVKWIGGIPNVIDEMGRSVWVSNRPSWNKLRFLKRDYKYIQQEGIFWRRSLWEDTGKYISTDFTLASDMELWARFFMLTDFFTFPGFLGSFRMRSSNQKSFESIDLYHKEAEQIIDNMIASDQEKKIIKKSNKLFYRFVRKLDNKHLWKLSTYSKVHSEIESYPKEIYYCRLSQKFLINF